MEVILLEKVANLGNLGDKVNVRPGYGRNFLMPKKKAVPATKENLAMFEERRVELEKAAAEVLATAQARAEQIANVGSISIKVNASDEGKLFGSVTVSDIATSVTEAGAEVSKSEVSMPDGPIHTIGEYDIAIHVHSDVSQTIKVVVEAE